MRRPTGWGLAVLGVFVVIGGAAIDTGHYATAICAGLISVVIGHVGPEVWQ